MEIHSLGDGWGGVQLFSLKTLVLIPVDVSKNC